MKNTVFMKLNLTALRGKYAHLTGSLDALRAWEKG